MFYKDCSLGSERETDRQTDRDRRHRERETHTQTETDGQTERQRHRDRERERQTERDHHLRTYQVLSIEQPLPPVGHLKVESSIGVFFRC